MCVSQAGSNGGGRATGPTHEDTAVDVCVRLHASRRLTVMCVAQGGDPRQPSSRTNLKGHDRRTRTRATACARADGSQCEGGSGWRGQAATGGRVAELTQKDTTGSRVRVRPCARDATGCGATEAAHVARDLAIDHWAA